MDFVIVLSTYKNMEEAIDKMRWFQHNNQAIFGTTLGRNPRREVIKNGQSGDTGNYRNKGQSRMDNQEILATLGTKGNEEWTIRSILATLGTKGNQEWTIRRYWKR
jgi:hypothetical protein